MKRNIATIISVLLIILTLCSCEKKTSEDTTQEAINPITEAASGESKPEKPTIVTTEPKKPIVESITPAITEDTTNVTPVTLEIPPFSYYLSDKVRADDNQPIQLTMLSSTSNEITDEDKWFVDNNLSPDTYVVPNSYRYTNGNLPEEIASQWNDLILTSAFYDDSYIYCTYGSNYFEGYQLNIYNKNSYEIIYSIDFSNYCYAPEYVTEDFDYILQAINWAVLKDNILYVSHSHNTYAKSSNNMNAYITAIDLTDMSILWRTDSLVSNGYNFQIIDDVIISGYGFTDEPDFLYQIDTSSGKVIDKIPLKTAAEYIIKKDNVLYVRTYNMNYEFEVTQ